MIYKNEKSALLEDIEKDQFIQNFENNVEKFGDFWNQLELPESETQQQKQIVFKELVYNIFSDKIIQKLNQDQFNILWQIFQELFLNSMSQKWSQQQAHDFFKQQILLYGCDRVWIIKKEFDLDQIVQIFEVFYENFISKINMYQECFSTKKNTVIEIKLQNQKNENEQKNVLKPRLLSQESVIEKENKLREKILKAAEKKFREEISRNNQLLSLQFEMKIFLIFLFSYTVLSLDLSAVSEIPMHMYDTKQSLMEKELRKVYETELQGVKTQQKLTEKDNFLESLNFVHKEIKKIQNAKIKIKEFDTIDRIKKYNKLLNKKKKVQKQKKVKVKKSRQLKNKTKKKTKRNKHNNKKRRKLLEKKTKTSKDERERRKLLQKFHDLDSKDQMKKIKRIYQNYGINVKKLGVKDLRFLIQNTKKLLKKYYKDDQKKKRRRRERRLYKKSHKKHHKRKHNHRERRLRKQNNTIKNSKTAFTRLINSKTAKDITENPNGEASHNLMQAIDPSVAEQMIKKRKPQNLQRNLKQIKRKHKKNNKKLKKQHKKNALKKSHKKKQTKTKKNRKLQNKNAKKKVSKKNNKKNHKQVQKKVVVKKHKKVLKKASKKNNNKKLQKKHSHKKQRKLQLQPPMQMSPQLQQQYYQQMMQKNPQLYQRQMAQYYQQAQMMQQQQGQQNGQQQYNQQSGQQQQQYPQMSQEQYNKLYQQYSQSQKTQKLSPQLMKKLYPQYYQQPYQAQDQQQQNTQLNQGRLLSLTQDKHGLRGTSKLLNSIRTKLKDPELLKDLKNEMSRGNNMRITKVKTAFTDSVSAKQIQGYTRGLKNMTPGQLARKMYSGFPQSTLPPIPLRKGGGSSSFYGMNELTGGQMNIKFPDDPPVVFMTQQPFYSYI